MPGNPFISSKTHGGADGTINPAWRLNKAGPRVPSHTFHPYDHQRPPQNPGPTGHDSDDHAGHDTKTGPGYSLKTILPPDLKPGIKPDNRTAALPAPSLAPIGGRDFSVGTCRDSGNAFFIILIGVVLFAALAFTFSKGIQQGGENISNRQAALIASDILTYGQKMARAVQAMVAHGSSENDISFENDSIGGYNNANCLAGSGCFVFKADGAGLIWQAPPANSNNSEPYFFGINQIGLDSEPLGPERQDLVMLLPVKMSVCRQVNAMTTDEDIWTSPRALNSTIPFQGDYTAPAGSGISWTTSPDIRPAGCFCTDIAPCQRDDHFFVYYILHARG